MEIKTIKFTHQPSLNNTRKSRKHPKVQVDMSKLRDTLQKKIQNRKSYITSQPNVVTTQSLNNSSINNVTEINDPIKSELTDSIEFMNKAKNNPKPNSPKYTNTKASKITIKSRSVNGSPKSVDDIIKKSGMLPINSKISIPIPGCLKNGLNKTYKHNKSIKNRETVKPCVTFKPDLIEPKSTKPHSIIHNIDNISDIILPTQPPQPHPPTTSITIPDNNIHSTDISVVNEPISILPNVIDITNMTDLENTTTTTTTTSISQPSINNNTPNIPSSDIKEIVLSTEPFTTNTTDSSGGKASPNPPTDPPPIISTIVAQTDTTLPIIDISNNQILTTTTTEHKNNESGINKIIKKTLKSYKVGKHANGTRKISVFCKNKDNIKDVTAYTKEISNTNINKMKQYLITNTLLSVGSYAPDDVIKQMYINAKLAGHIVNHNNDILLNNYMTNSENI